MGEASPQTRHVPTVLKYELLCLPVPNNQRRLKADAVPHCAAVRDPVVRHLGSEDTEVTAREQHIGLGLHSELHLPSPPRDDASSQNQDVVPLEAAPTVKGMNIQNVELKHK
ncbi:hypothetical protein E2C01_008807 [Portunus trituberculatus]|uniref:Uncharacterized protein n=1 Tax=Portunus trituberculatus TaxID=210409 RepID=A0A5B7D2X5_PORTR|nr:hypothetical protein [Portunus trituberculatus]